MKIVSCIVILCFCNVFAEVTGSKNIIFDLKNIVENYKIFDKNLQKNNNLRFLQTNREKLFNVLGAFLKYFDKDDNGYVRSDEIYEHFDMNENSCIDVLQSNFKPVALCNAISEIDNMSVNYFETWQY